MKRHLSGFYVLLLASCQQRANPAGGANAPASHNGQPAPSAPVTVTTTPSASASPSATASSNPLNEQGTPPVVERLRSIAGLEPKAVEQYLSDLKGSTAKGDRAAVCRLVEYPIFVDTPKAKMKVATAGACEKSYEKIFTPRVVDAIGKQRFADLFVNSRGVMIGDGQIWFGGVCDNDQCSGRVDIRIKAINN